MTPAKHRPASPSLRRIAKPPALATVFVPECGRVAFLERVVELPAAAMVVFVSERKRVALRKWVVESSVAAMAALVSGCGRIAVRQWAIEPSAAAMVISGSECRRVVLRQQVFEPLALVGVAIVGDPDFGCSGVGGGMGPGELRLQAFLLLVVGPSAAAVVFAAECGRGVLQLQALEPPPSAAAALAGDHEPVPMVSVRERVAA